MDCRCPGDDLSLGRRSQVNEIEVFQEFLREQGQKLTHQRGAILKRILAVDVHFSAEDLFETLRGDGISKATVYRTLSLLVEAGILDALDFERGHMLYERRNQGEHHHDHLVCLSCKQIFEFHDEEIERLQEIIAQKHDFKVVSHTHHIYGECGSCRREGKSDASPRERRASRRSPRIHS